MTEALDAVHVISVPLTWTFAPALIEALHSASLVVLAPPMHVKLADDALTSIGKSARPFTDILNAADAPELTFPSSSMPWPSLPPLTLQLAVLGGVRL